LLLRRFCDLCGRLVEKRQWYKIGKFEEGPTWGVAHTHFSVTPVGEICTACLMKADIYSIIGKLIVANAPLSSNMYTKYIIEPK